MGGALVLTASAALGGVAASGIAEAASPNANVYIAFPSWAGNCPRGGSVVSVYGTVGESWTSTPTGDRGDDLIYVPVRLRQPTSVQVQLFCKKGGWLQAPYKSVVFPATITPTRNRQTFWLGPATETHN